MKPSKSAGIVFLCLLFCLMAADNSRAISILEEKKLAEEYVDMIKHSSMIMEDPIVNHMVRQIGQHLLSFVEDQPFDYTFYVINDDVFNAFAAPGAHLFFYRGLITALDSVDELAGIMSHEISHAVSRHVSESIDRSKYVSIGTLAGVLASAIIGSQSGGDAGVTLIKGSMALGQTSMLSFTRENETEADEKAILFLKKSCFSPEGLMTGLLKIRNADFKGIEQIPEYVKTHPGTGDRIAHTEAILSGYVPEKTKIACPEDFRFDMVKYRLLGLYADLDPTFDKLMTLEKQNPSNAALHYGLGLLYERKFMADKALVHFKKALSIHVFDPMILLEMGRLYLASGSPEKALQLLQGIESDPVMGIMARFHQASAYLELNELTKARNGFDFVINKAPSVYPQAYLKLANIYSIEKNQGLSAYNLGLYYSEIGRDKTAIIHLNRALDTLSDDSVIKKTKTLLDRLKKEAAKKPQP
ncbi:MAG: M48 family metalloprotease [Pseudomonadota bacterium]